MISRRQNKGGRMDRTPSSVSALREQSLRDGVILGFVVAVATALATSMLVNYAADPGELWRGINADRNPHFAFGVNLAIDLRDLNIVGFLDGVINARLWP